LKFMNVRYFTLNTETVLLFTSLWHGSSEPVKKKKKKSLVRYN